MADQSREKRPGDKEESSDMHYDNDHTPTQSPRDKRPRTQSEGESPTRSPRGPVPITVAASPPKFVSMEEIMKAAKGVDNLALAHEIAVDSNFSINPAQAPANSLEKRVKDAVHQAFWDILAQKLREDPPDYSHAVILLAEIKENLLGLLLPQHVSIRQQVNEVLDMDLIEQKADHGAIDFQYYAGFIIDLMSKLCAEARDEEIARLRTIKDIVPLYREVFAVLDHMKLDMANFTIRQMRPFIQQQSAQYEKSKFDNFLQQQKDNGVDGLKFTKAWLERNFLILSEKQKNTVADPSSASSSTAGTSSTSSGVTAGAAAGAAAGGAGGKALAPTLVLNEAYLELLQWDFDHQIFPETVLLDEARFITLMQRVKWLSIVSSILLVTYNEVGAPLAGVAGLKERLKEQMATIMTGVPESQIGEAMKNVSMQIIKEVQECLSKHGFSKLDAAREDRLTKQIEVLADAQHRIRQLMQSRVLGFIRSILSHPQEPQSVQIPPGLSAVSQELSDTTSAFVRLVSHNQKVFGGHYADIIKSLLGVQ